MTDFILAVVLSFGIPFVYGKMKERARKENERKEKQKQENHEKMMRLLEKQRGFDSRIKILLKDAAEHEAKKKKRKKRRGDSLDHLDEEVLRRISRQMRR